MEEQDKKYILYIKEKCPFCIKARELLSIYEKEFYTISLDDSPGVLKEMKSAWSHETVPMVFQCDSDNPIDTTKFIGGYTDLKNMLSDE